MYTEGLASFRCLLQIVGSAKNINVTYAVKPLDEYGRFVNWGEQTRAYLPSQSRGSLDEHIREHPKIEQVVESTLQQLIECLDSGECSMFFATKCY
jgi:hypothetical protein